MAQHIDNVNHNVYWDGVTLTNCTYVRCGEGCTGTFINCNYMEIGENNTDLTMTNVDYLTMGDNNKTVTVYDADYTIIGSDGENIKLGEHTTTRFTGRTGSNSITIGHRVIGAEITGRNSEIDRSRNLEIDGTFTRVRRSGVIFVDEANGNTLDNSSRIDLTLTHNSQFETANIQLNQKKPFIDYATIDDVIRVKDINPVINRQSDATAMIVDNSLNTIINKNKEGKGRTHYTKQNGIWVEVND